MKKLYIDIIGIVAGTCTSMSFIPQIVKILRTKQVRDISLRMYIVLTSGISLWLVYGILIKEFPIILANGAALVLCTTVIIAKIRYGEKE